MDLSTTPRRIPEGVSELQKTRVAKSVFSIRSLVDVGETELADDMEKTQSEFRHVTISISSFYTVYTERWLYYRRSTGWYCTVEREFTRLRNGIA